MPSGFPDGFAGFVLDELRQSGTLQLCSVGLATQR